MEYFEDVRATNVNINPTPYKISTITATGDINVHLHLDVLFEAVPLVARDNMDALWGFSSAQFSVEDDAAEEGNGGGEEDVPNKRRDAVLVKRSALDIDGNPVAVQRSSRRKRRQARHFDNQCTLIYWDSERRAAGIERGVNVKCFRNGRVQMTGVRHVREGGLIIERLVEMVRAIQKERGDLVPADQHDGMRASNYKVCLINSDFNLGLQVRRDVLHHILAKEYGLVCSFEPCIYPGVKLSFMWNQSKVASQSMSQNQSQNGKCECKAPPCKGTGDGRSMGNCRRVTCAIFQSGCTIITGAHCYTQLEDTYKFICGVVSKHKDEIQRRAAPALPVPSGN